MLQQQADSLQILVMGTSQTFHSLNPALFNKPTLNLAAPAQPFYYDCKIVLTYLPRLKNLRLVIVPVDYLSLFFEADTSFNYHFYYYRFWGFAAPHEHYTNLNKYSLLAFYKPIVARQMIMQMIHEKNIHPRFETSGMLDNGFMGLNDAVDTTQFEQLAAMKITRWHDTLMSKKYFQDNAERLENLVTVLEKKKVKVLLLSTPVIKNFYQRYDSSYNHIRAGFIRHLISIHPNVTYADFSTDTRFMLKDFFNPNHLNKIGAVKFSNIIQHDYIGPMLH